MAVTDLDGPSFFERARPWWHVALVLDLVATGLLAGFDDLGARYWVVLGGLAAIGALYATIGRRALLNDSTRTAWLYLAPAWAIFLGLSHVTNTAQVLLFVLFPQSWAMLPKAAAAATSFCAMASMLVLRVTAGDDPAVAVLSSGIDLALSLLLGYWVYGIAEESERRRALVRELERTRAELAEVSREAGVLAERQRLSQEIHDTLAQGFTSLLTLARAAEAELEPGQDAARDRLRLMQRAARQNLAEARALVAALAPADLADADLGDALRHVCDRFTAERGVSVELAVSGTRRPLTRNADVVVVRTVQEALTNVGKHAAARSAAVCLEYRAGDIVVTITDDGRGLPGEFAKGFGIGGMRARAADIGGRLDVAGRDGGGTVVRLELP